MKIEAAVGALAAAPSYTFYNNSTNPNTSTAAGGRECRCCCLASAKQGSSHPGLLLLTGPASVLHDEMIGK